MSEEDFDRATLMAVALILASERDAPTLIKVRAVSLFLAGAFMGITNGHPKSAALVLDEAVALAKSDMRNMAKAVEGINVHAAPEGTQ